jgi:hypothetical protein
LGPFAWSLACMQDGKWPMRDHLNQPWPQGSNRCRMAGQQLAGTYFGALVDSCGDWDFQCKLYHLPTWSSADMCWCCHARNDGLLQYSNVAPTAPWRAMPRTTADILALQPPGQFCPLLHLSGWDVRTIKWDVMHSFNMGVARLVCGGVLLDLCKRGAFGAGEPLAVQLKRAWSAHAQWCRLQRLQCRCKRFTPGRLNANKRSEFVELLCPKAAAVRVVAAWLAVVACAQPDSGATEGTRLVTSLSWAVAELFATMEKGQRFFTADETAHFCRAGACILPMCGMQLALPC